MLSHDDTIKLLGETNLEGYPALVSMSRGIPDLRSRLLGTEREIRRCAEHHGIDLTPYPNADLAERTLG